MLSNGFFGLAQFQAKESTDIPDEVYDEILVEMKKQRLLDILLKINYHQNHFVFRVAEFMITLSLK